MVIYNVCFKLKQTYLEGSVHEDTEVQQFGEPILKYQCMYEGLDLKLFIYKIFLNKE